jgi:hypothetical protein
MLFYSDDLARDYAAQRRRKLQAEAEVARLLRSAGPAAAARVGPGARLRYALGSLLVRWGRGLQGHSRLPAAPPAFVAPFVDTRGA